MITTLLTVFMKVLRPCISCPRNKGWGEESNGFLHSFLEVIQLLVRILGLPSCERMDNLRGICERLVPKRSAFIKSVRSRYICSCLLKLDLDGQRIGYERHKNVTDLKIYQILGRISGEGD